MRITDPESEFVASQPAGDERDSDLSLSDLKSSDVSSWMVSKYIYDCPTLPCKNKLASETKRHTYIRYTSIIRTLNFKVN